MPGPYSFGGTSTARLLTCHPLIVALFQRVIRRPDLPHDLTVVYGHRTNAEQAALYAKGRTTPGPKVTNAAPACYARGDDPPCLPPRPRPRPRLPRAGLCPVRSRRLGTGA